MWNIITLLYTSDNKDMMLGGYLASHCGERIYQIDNLNQDMIKGVEIYNKINKTLRSHSSVNDCIRRLSPFQRKYGHKVIGVFFDHFLLKNWNIYSNEDLNTIISTFHLHADEHTDLIPYKSRNMLTICMDKNIYQNAASIQGLNSYFEALEGSKTYLSYSVGDLTNQYNEFYIDFNIAMNFIREEFVMEKTCF